LSGSLLKRKPDYSGEARGILVEAGDENEPLFIKWLVE